MWSKRYVTSQTYAWFSCSEILSVLPAATNINWSFETVLIPHNRAYSIQLSDKYFLPSSLIQIFIILSISQPRPKLRVDFTVIEQIKTE